MARCKKRDTQYTIFGKTLTEDEIFLLISHPTYAQNAYDCTQEAITKTRELYPDECQDGARENAFQHAYWVILMYYDTSPSFAIEFAVAHENYDGNPELHKTMDLYNDYAAYNFCVSLNNDNQDYSITVLENFARNLKQMVRWNILYLLMSIYTV